MVKDAVVIPSFYRIHVDRRNIYEYVTCGACTFSKAEEKILRFQEYPVTYWQGLKRPSHCISSSLKTLDMR